MMSRATAEAAVQSVCIGVHRWFQLLACVAEGRTRPPGLAGRAALAKTPCINSAAGRRCGVRAGWGADGINLLPIPHAPVLTDTHSWKPGSPGIKRDMAG